MRKYRALTLVEILVVLAIIYVLLALLLPREQSREPQRMKRCSENIQTVIKAIKTYEAKHGPLPAVICDSEGKPLYSWRAAILPYLGEEGMIAEGQLQKNEPWDGETNIDITAPAVFRCPSCGVSMSDKTLADYALVVDRNAAKDGSAYPMILETVPSVHWLNPIGLTQADFEKGPPRRLRRSDPGFSEYRFGSFHPGKACVGFSDGKVKWFDVPPLERKNEQP